MKGDTETDVLLRERFARLRGEDSAHVPDFAAMMARAHRAVDEHEHATEEPVDRGVGPSSGDGRSDVLSADRARRAFPRLGTPLTLRWVIPIAVAAGLAAITLLPHNRDRAADQEFDRLVSEWSRTSDVTRRAPTDGLLTLPGIGLLENMPAVGSGVGALPGRS